MAALAKFATGKSLWAIGTLWAVTYYAYYNSGDWSKHGGWRVHESKPPTMPDNPSYPKKDPRWEPWSGLHCRGRFCLSRDWTVHTSYRRHASPGVFLLQELLSASVGGG